MRMNGAVHDEESLAVAQEFARSVIAGRTRSRMEGKADLLGDGLELERFDLVILTFPAQQALVPVLKPEAHAEDAVARTMECGPASHRWSRPEERDGQTFASCKRCGVEISSTVQGDAKEVMTDLMRQIPSSGRI